MRIAKANPTARHPRRYSLAREGAKGILRWYVRYIPRHRRNGVGVARALRGMRNVAS